MEENDELVVTKTYPSNVLEKLFYKSVVEKDGYNLKLIKSEYINYDRWSIDFNYIFKDVTTGKLYEFSYGHGATEYQDDPGFYTDLGDGEIECTEVEPVEVPVIMYTPVEKWEE